MRKYSIISNIWFNSKVFNMQLDLNVWHSKSRSIHIERIMSPKCTHMWFWFSALPPTWHRSARTAGVSTPWALPNCKHQVTARTYVGVSGRILAAKTQAAASPACRFVPAICLHPCYVWCAHIRTSMAVCINRMMRCSLDFSRTCEPTAAATLRMKFANHV